MCENISKKRGFFVKIFTKFFSKRSKWFFKVLTKKCQKLPTTRNTNEITFAKILAGQENFCRYSRKLQFFDIGNVKMTSAKSLRKRIFSDDENDNFRWNKKFRHIRRLSRHLTFSRKWKKSFLTSTQFTIKSLDGEYSLHFLQKWPRMMRENGVRSLSPHWPSSLLSIFPVSSQKKSYLLILALSIKSTRKVTSVKGTWIWASGNFVSGMSLNIKKDNG